jgi:hypothetical protein
MAEEKPQPSPKPLQKPIECATMPPVKTQASQPVLKPDKNARVPNYHMENFSGGEKED